MPGHRIACGIEARDPVDRMAVRGDLVAHGGAQNRVVLDQQDAHGWSRSSSLRLSMSVSTADGKLTHCRQMLQDPVSFAAQGSMRTWPYRGVWPMKKTLTILAFLAVFPAGAALADDDCFVPMADWQPREAVAQLAESKGWTVRRIKIDDGCYEIDGRDAEGRRIEVTVHPATLEVHGDRVRGR